jgi:hypothetical protein
MRLVDRSRSVTPGIAMTFLGCTAINKTFGGGLIPQLQLSRSAMSTLGGVAFVTRLASAGQ